MGKDAESQRIILLGESATSFTNNRITTAKYSHYSFFPLALKDQFKKNGNVYFLCMGCIMYVGTAFPNFFETAVTPWTTLGPLAVVISVSLAQEAAADLTRHKSDNKENSHPCVVLRNAEDLDRSNGKVKSKRLRDESIKKGKDVVVDLVDFSVAPNDNDIEEGKKKSVHIAFESVQRKNIFPGDLILVRNRDMVPADMILLASSGDKGTTYIETSSIDGETNLKLRSSPITPSEVFDKLDSNCFRDSSTIFRHKQMNYESLEHAVSRIASQTLLGYPDGLSSLDNLSSDQEKKEEYSFTESESRKMNGDKIFISTITSEAPNASVNTYSGKLTLPPISKFSPSNSISLGADNILLRGAMIRNTEWAIGVVCFTGKDTKLSQNSAETPSKFSYLDRYINWTVWWVLLVYLSIVLLLGRQAYTVYNEQFDRLWYAGYSSNSSAAWPYLDSLPAPDWDTNIPHYYQSVLTFTTMLTNFVPLSLYVTVEMIILFMMYLIHWDKNMYHEETDTAAEARSPNMVTDLGLVEYIFSDKTGTLTQNVMKFKRCSVDGMVFGAPVAESSTQKSPSKEDGNDSMDIPNQAFHPLTRLLVDGKASDDDVGVSYINPSEVGTEQSKIEVSINPFSNADYYDDKKSTLTFNAEMFLRIMSICHTVVVEQEIDASKIEGGSDNGEISAFKKIFSSIRTRTSTEDSQRTIKNMFKGLRSRTNTEDSKISIRKRENRSRSNSCSNSRASSRASSRSDNRLRSNSEDIVQTQRSLLDSDDESGSKVDVSENLGNESSSQMIISTPLVGSRIDGSLVDGSIASLMVGNFDDFPQDYPKDLKTDMSPDGAPLGYGYQAESPDDGALVSAASSTFGFQFIERDSDSINIKCKFASLLADSRISSALKDKSLKPNKLALETASPLFVGDRGNVTKSSRINRSSSIEKWSILAINKFDSDRKRMSVLVRSPPELGSVPMLLCKGADSSLLDPAVCEAGDKVLTGSNDDDILQKNKGSLEDEENWEYDTMLSIQAHLGMFASEGLRTLVLGLRILSEEECSNWLTKFELASNSMKDRERKLQEVAVEIETKLYIVGSTAIEDKLQDGVPETICNIGKAGIKLWVLTGDKRETAIEIGYATKVLTPTMRLTQVAGGTELKVKAMIAKEFLWLVKSGLLAQYQQSALEHSTFSLLSLLKKCTRRVMYSLGKVKRTLSRGFRVFYHTHLTTCFGFYEREKSKVALKIMEKEARQEKPYDNPFVHRQKVRDLSETILKEYKNMSEFNRDRDSLGTGLSFSENGLSHTIDDNYNNHPVINRAKSAQSTLDYQKDAGRVTRTSLRSLSLASITLEKVKEFNEVDNDDVLSLQSFLPTAEHEHGFEFDKKRRTILEKMFAVDPDVRQGCLVKHLSKDKRKKVLSKLRNNTENNCTIDDSEENPNNTNAHRALVIEGSSLTHILGNQLLEEMLFAVASSCESVIACRVSPKQKALLVNLVQEYVVPTPVTLAIGDGANDVGMIQAAQVGIGISGLEGRQAVNASDFSIAQFRFLEDLLLIHGRWNLIRMSKVILFSFYKNATLTMLIICYSSKTLYSGQILFDPWVYAGYNFICVFPILFLGCFDRDLEKEYVKRNPHLYSAGPKGEHLNGRVLLRWMGVCILSTITIFYMNLTALGVGGGMTSAYRGLMKYADNYPGDGEGGSLVIFGTTIYSCLIMAMALKVLYESRTLIHGEWPLAFTCRKDAGEGYFSRVAYTWVGVFWLSIVFYFFFIFTYQVSQNTILVE